MCTSCSSTNFVRNRVVFWENLHSWHKFYTTAGRDGRDKSQLCCRHVLDNFFFILRRQRSNLSYRNCKVIQKVSQEVREASRYHGAGFVYIVQKAVRLSIIDYLKICKTVSYSLTETAQLVSRGFLRKKYLWQMITSNNDMTEWERHSWNDAEHKFHRKQQLEKLSLPLAWWSKNIFFRKRRRRIVPVFLVPTVLNFFTRLRLHCFHNFGIINEAIYRAI